MTMRVTHGACAADLHIGGETQIVRKLNVLMVGSGEYTTGYVHDGASKSDKSAGVVALSMADLRRRGWVDRILMSGTNGQKMPAIREHLQAAVSATYRDLDASVETFPGDEIERDPSAYQNALGELNAGDVVTVFTPDDTHYSIAMDAVKAGCHVLIAKPLVKSVDQHRNLVDEAKKRGVLVAMEVHKRWDPIYVDARDRIRALGDFSFFNSYMSQPKSQLETFRAWAGRSSDISYYLNSHHIDFLLWAVGENTRPIRVHASAARGYADSIGIETEDTITLTVGFENVESHSQATAVFTASWIAPPSDVHSQQRFFFMGHRGEVVVDQAHRGYSLATDDSGFASANPLFMKYTPDADGCFAGQGGYGFRSIEAFVEAAGSINEGRSVPSDYKSRLAAAESTIGVTAILQAGRMSLDANRVIEFRYDSGGDFELTTR